jgi:hypothetical protein
MVVGSNLRNTIRAVSDRHRRSQGITDFVVIDPSPRSTWTARGGDLSRAALTALSEVLQAFA